MGTPDFAIPSLKALALEHEIIAVYTQPDRPSGRGNHLTASPIKSEALKMGIPVFQPEKLTLPGEFEKLQILKPDFIVVVAYGQILKKNVLELPSLGCINIHGSLLPRWRGAAPIHWSIMGGDKETGVTTMHMAEKLDAGDMLLSKAIQIGDQETVNKLHDRMSVLGAELILPTLAGLENKSLKGVHQNESLVTYASKITKEMSPLQWQSNSAVILERRIRALNRWPGTTLKLEFAPEKKLFVRKSHVILGQFQFGKLIDYAGEIVLGTVENGLILDRLQWEGKSEQSPAEFLNGLRGRKLEMPLGSVKQ